MRETELIVPMLVSLGMMVSMFKSFTLAPAETGVRRRFAPVPLRPDVVRANRADMQFEGGEKITALRPFKPEDAAHARRIAERTRMAIEKYADHKLALADGYRIVLPNVAQPVYHFTNYWYGFKAGFIFDPEHPTSLLYRKTSDGEYRLIGAMFTAPARFSESQLHERVPLSVAQWHRHVTSCRASKRTEPGNSVQRSKYSSEESSCNVAEAMFQSHIFGWTLHIYPFERDPKEVWSTEPAEFTLKAG